MEMKEDVFGEELEDELEVEGRMGWARNASSWSASLLEEKEMSEP